MSTLVGTRLEIAGTIGRVIPLTGFQCGATVCDVAPLHMCNIGAHALPAAGRFLIALHEH
ncbi:MAG: hypothetical protein JSS17_15905 [Proteobacteria bacterium]|nr:hypothetical protein [Pseudomonadota bacterium]